MTVRRRVLLTGLPSLVAALPGLIVALRGWDRLPAEVASHFALDGVADGVGAKVAVLAIHVAVALGLGVLFGGTAAAGGLQGSARIDGSKLLAGISWATGALTGGIFLLAVLANLGAATPLDARLPPIGMLAVLALTAVAGLVGASLMPPTPAAPDTGAAAPSIPVGPAERLSWTGRCSSRPIGLLGGVLLGAGIAVLLLDPTRAGITLLVVGVALLLFGSARTTVDRRGVTVALGILGWPRLHVPLADIASATATDVSALRFGGWGYRLVPGGSGVIVRSGSALVVTRRSGRTLTVTVDDAATAAGLLTGLQGERAC